MIRIDEKSNCCGCTACYNACPAKAIQMKPDKEGFLYPVVDEKKCVDCNICESTCPIQNRPQADENTRSFILRNRDLEVVKQSTSGGVFTLIAQYLLNHGFIVYGTGYDSDMKVVCKVASHPEELAEMRGSKFVQSHLGFTFSEIKKKLKNGERVLFSGTPCQVAGLIAFLGNKPDNLICLDFVCRGVPSPGLWKNYVSMMERKYGSQMIEASFKNKTYGYHSTTMKVSFSNGKTWTGSGRVDPMMKAFVCEMASRPSCHSCQFKGIMRVSDITMFDCYKFSEITGEADDDKGYSSVLVHSDKGMKILDAIKGDAVLFHAPLDQLVEKNGIMINHSSKPNPRRDTFYELCYYMPIDQAMNRVNPITQKDKIIEASKSILYRTGLIKTIRKFKKEEIQVND